MSPWPSVIARWSSVNPRGVNHSRWAAVEKADGAGSPVCAARAPAGGIKIERSIHGAAPAGAGGNLTGIRDPLDQG